MDNNNIKEEILKILKKHPEGLTISQVAKEIGMHRHSVVKYIYELTGEKKVIQRKIGPATLCYIYSKKMKNIYISILFIFLSISFISETVEASNITLYPRNELVGPQFPTG